MSCWGKSSAEGVGRPAQGSGGHRVGAGRPADAEVDAAGMERLEHPELLGHHQRRMVGQHHPPEPSAWSWSPSARWAISTAGAELAMPGMLWCSATQ